MMSTTKAEIKEFKTNCYIEISVYLILMIITTIIINLFETYEVSIIMSISIKNYIWKGKI